MSGFDIVYACTLLRLQIKKTR